MWLIPLRMLMKIKHFDVQTYFYNLLSIMKNPFEQDKTTDDTKAPQMVIDAGLVNKLKFQHYSPCLTITVTVT